MLLFVAYLATFVAGPTEKCSFLSKSLVVGWCAPFFSETPCDNGDVKKWKSKSLRVECRVKHLNWVSRTDSTAFWKSVIFDQNLDFWSDFSIFCGKIEFWTKNADFHFEAIFVLYIVWGRLTRHSKALNVLFHLKNFSATFVAFCCLFSNILFWPTGKKNDTHYSNTNDFDENSTFL